MNGRIELPNDILTKLCQGIKEDSETIEEKVAHVKETRASIGRIDDSLKKLRKETT